MSLCLPDVVGPPCVVVHRIDAQADDFGLAFVELRLEPRHVAELGRAYRGEVLRARAEHRPRVAHPLVKMDTTLGGLSLEIRSDIANLESHHTPPWITVTDNVAGRDRPARTGSDALGIERRTHLAHQSRQTVQSHLARARAGA